MGIAKTAEESGSGRLQCQLFREMVHPFFESLKLPTLTPVPMKHPQKGTSHDLHCSGTGDVLRVGKMFAAKLASNRSRSDRTVSLREPLPAEVLLASISLSLYLSKQDPEKLAAEWKEGTTLFISPEQDPERLAAEWKAWQNSAKSSPAKDSHCMRPLQSINGSYCWVMQSNGPEQRLQRLAASFSTLRYCAKLDSARRLVDNTVIIHSKALVGTSTRHSQGHPRCELHLVPSSAAVLDVAVDQVRRTSRRVVAVNAASAYQVGGGFLTGGRHALEESMCMQSTLFLSLKQAARLASDRGIWDKGGFPIHIPEDGAVLSPGVEVFRHGTFKGYEMKDDSVMLTAILSIAMPNLNPSVTDTPSQTSFCNSSAYDDELEQKWEAVLCGSIQQGAQVLVVPDAGCGVYQNSPSIVGHAFGSVLRRYHKRMGAMETVYFTGNSEFYKAARDAYEGRQQKETSRDCSQYCGIM